MRSGYDVIYDFYVFSDIRFEKKSLWIMLQVACNLMKNGIFDPFKFRKSWKLIFDLQPNRTVPWIPVFKQLLMMNVYCYWDKVLFLQTYCENIFEKVSKIEKNQQKCENENSRETTKLVIIISNREHTLDVISKAFIFWSCWQKFGFRVRHVIENFSR